ncbi:MAG TPA: DbpA RNA binding domain-containing protein [Longimicrobiales bacterium]|nr:DbpA RNA binding domain-containing protein [Longimicrobiales bacterium]
MSGFDDLGLGGALLDAVERQGWDRPTPLQETAYAVLRRGGNGVLWASSGAGLVGAYALPLLSALGEDAGEASAAAGEGESAGGERADHEHAGGPRALVLTPTPDRAEHVATAIGRLAAGTGIRVAALSEGWPDATRAGLVVGDVAEVARRISRSALKLEAVTAVVIEGAEAVAGAPALDTVIAALPPAAQRIVTAADDDPRTRELIERVAPRAMGIPPRSEVTAAHGTTTTAHYLVVAEDGRAGAIARLEQAAGPGITVHTRSEARAEALREALAARGFAAVAEGASLRVGGEEGEAAFVVSADVPADAETFSERHADGGLVLVAARELAHARRAAAVAGIALRPRPTAPRDDVADALTTFRGRVERALEEEDLDAQTLVLAPLVEEHGPLQVAAALSALVRRRPVASDGADAGDPPARAPEARAAPAAAGAPRAAAPAPRSEPAFRRIFISVGRKDGAGPGDIVGAIAGETGVAGDRIGRIEMAETHAIVEIASDDARRVIDALNGTTIRGRSVRVDFDRPRRSRPERRMRTPGSR